jgi:hypothetical protein
MHALAKNNERFIILALKNICFNGNVLFLILFDGQIG